MALTGSSVSYMEGRTVLPGPETGVTEKGGDRKGSEREGGQEAEGRERERETERDREGCRVTGEQGETTDKKRKMRKQQKPKLAWACVLWLWENSVFS